MEKRYGAGAGNITDMTISPLPEAGKILVLAPHPDDESLGCGGTIALYSTKGVEVHLAVISRGEAIAAEFAGADTDIAGVRREELKKASGILGIRDIFYFEFPDGKLLSCINEIEEAMGRLIDRISPDLVFAPSPLDFNEDHRAVSEIALRLLKSEGGMRVAFYEVYGTLRFNTLIDISDVMSVKELAVNSYYHSLLKNPALYLESMKGLNRFRAFHARESGYYEAFWVVSHPLTRAEAADWLTFGLKNEDPAALFLFKLKTVDELLFNLNKYRELLGSKDAAIRSLNAKLEGIKECEDLKIKIIGMEKSLFWKTARRYYRIRDTLLPANSRLKRIYDKMLSRIKNR